MLSDKVKNVLTMVCQKQGYHMPQSEEQYLEVLFECGRTVAELDRDSHRWWDSYYQIKQFDLGQQGKYYIGYKSASVTGDLSLWEVGWEFNDETVSFYQEKEKVEVIKYYEELTDDEVNI